MVRNQRSASGDFVSLHCIIHRLPLSFLQAGYSWASSRAAVAPFLTLISSQWCTNLNRFPQSSLWYLGVGVGQIVGQIVPYALQQVKHQPNAGLAIMPIVGDWSILLHGWHALPRQKSSLQLRPSCTVRVPLISSLRQCVFLRLTLPHLSHRFQNPPAL